MGASNASTPGGTGQIKRLARALQYAFPYRGTVLAIFLVTLLLAGINAAEPLVLKYLFDSIGFQRGKESVGVAIGLLIAIALCREVATGFTNWRTWYARLGIHHALLESTIERLHRMPLAFHREEGVGAIMTKLDRGIQGFIGAVSQILFNVFPAVLYLGISITIMFQLNWKLAVIVLCFVPVPGVIAAWAGPEQTRRERATSSIVGPASIPASTKSCPAS